jgi:hypothetical protein
MFDPGGEPYGAFLEDDDYPVLRGALAERYRDLSPRALERVVARTTGLEAEAMEDWLQSLAAAGQALLPVVAGALGTAFGGPVGGAVGGALGTAAAGAIGSAAGPQQGKARAGARGKRPRRRAGAGARRPAGSSAAPPAPAIPVSPARDPGATGPSPMAPAGPGLRLRRADGRLAPEQTVVRPLSRPGAEDMARDAENPPPVVVPTPRRSAAQWLAGAAAGFLGRIPERENTREGSRVLFTVLKPEQLGFKTWKDPGAFKARDDVIVGELLKGNVPPRPSWSTTWPSGSR